MYHKRMVRTMYKKQAIKSLKLRIHKLSVTEFLAKHLTYYFQIIRQKLCLAWYDSELGTSDFLEELLRYYI